MNRRSSPSKPRCCLQRNQGPIVLLVPPVDLKKGALVCYNAFSKGLNTLARTCCLWRWKSYERLASMEMESRGDRSGSRARGRLPHGVYVI
jgi:hypothetical protein